MVGCAVCHRGSLAHKRAGVLDGGLCLEQEVKWISITGLSLMGFHRHRTYGAVRLRSSASKLRLSKLQTPPPTSSKHLQSRFSVRKALSSAEA